MGRRRLTIGYRLASVTPEYMQVMASYFENSESAKFRMELAFF